MAVETDLIDMIRTLAAMANDPDHCTIIAAPTANAHAKLA